MAVYAVGDVQGCLDPLQRLLDQVRFEPDTDQLWLVGDLVNRGPQSLETLRFVRNLGKAALSVLGNHDLHLLALAAGVGTLRRGDTLKTLLEASDADELLDWLRHCPLLHHDADLNWTMVHAGLPPQWNLSLAMTCAAEIEQALRAPDNSAFFAKMYGDEPRHWSPELTGMSRLRYALNALTRMRYVTVDGALDHTCNAAPDQAPDDLTPWFRVPNRRNADLRIVCGHWSTLGLVQEANVLALDTGCIWGGQLSAARLDLQNIQLATVTCPQAQHPKTPQSG